MVKTPSKRRAASTTQPFTPQKRGLFEDGQWLCDCSPRKPAIWLQVRKENANKGRHFYKCDTSRCNFFLWDTDAETRERDALISNNCRSENGIVARVQAKGDPPATPSFPRASRPAPPPKSAPPQQRIFTGRAPSAGAMSQNSFEYNSDEEDTQSLYDGGASMQLHRQHAAQVVPGTSESSSSQTLGITSSGSRDSASIPFTTQPDRTSGPFQSNSNYQSAVTPSAKRKRGVFLEDYSDEDFGGADLDNDPELAALVDDSAKKHQQSVQRKLFEKTPREDGPSNGLPTPVSRNSLLITAEAETSRTAKRARFASIPEDEEGDSKANILQDAQTPTPYRKTDAYAIPDLDPTTPSTTRVLDKTPASTASSSGGGGGGGDHPKIAEEVLSLLERQPLSEAVRQKLKTALDRHELRVRGVVLGRDVARQALTERDERIAELQARVVNLENSRRMERAKMRELSDGLVKLSQEAD